MRNLDQNIAAVFEFKRNGDILRPSDPELPFSRRKFGNDCDIMQRLCDKGMVNNLVLQRWVING
jgi:hypothetical protein